MPDWNNCGVAGNEHALQRGRGRAGHRRSNPPLAGAAARRPLPALALTREELRQVAAALADVPPLTAAQRRLWVAVAGDEVPAEPTPPWRFRPALAGALAAAVMGVIVVWWALRPVDLRQGPPVVADVDASAVKQEALRDVEGLRGSVVGLAQELDDLRRRAELLDARKDVDALIARLDTRGESRGL